MENLNGQMFYDVHNVFFTEYLHGHVKHVVNLSADNSVAYSITNHTCYFVYASIYNVFTQFYISRVVANFKIQYAIYHKLTFFSFQHGNM